MERKKTLTNEGLKNRFKNQFDLVNYAIKRASSMIESGRDPEAGLDTQNPAFQVLAEIAMGRDRFDMIEVNEDEEESTEV